MKSIAAQILILTRQRRTQRNLKVLGWFMVVLVGLMAVNTVLFHVIMEYEGQEHSWLSGLYWVLVTMSTLGFGDITFKSDLGRLFSIVVVISGTIFLLALLPFMFIQFFYAPWIEAQTAARTPRELPATTSGHVVLTNLDAVTEALIARLGQVGQDYVVLVPDVDRARKLHDRDVRVMVGEPDDPQAYRAARVGGAAMVVTTRNDAQDTAVAFAVRAVSETVPVFATADLGASVPIMEMAGATGVIRLDRVMGQALARCIAGGDALTHEVARFDNLIIAEASAARTPLIGKSLRDNRLSELGVNVVGLWDRGVFRPARPDIEVIARCTLDKHVSALHRAGADFVQSYASTGASAFYNLLHQGRMVTVAQGLEVFDVKVPKAVAGKRIIDSGIREATGCTIVGYRDGEGLTANPAATTVLKAGHELVLIGDVEAHEAYRQKYAEG